MNTSTDRIEKKILLHASQSKVWRALTTAEEFGHWFGVKLECAFAPNTLIKGNMTSSGYEHLNIEFTIDKMNPEHYFSLRWHPYAINPKIDYSSEPMTLIEFRLEPVNRDTLLTVTESGFDQIPLARRTEAYRMNEHGWAIQLLHIERYVS